MRTSVDTLLCAGLALFASVASAAPSHPHHRGPPSGTSAPRAAGSPPPDAFKKLEETYHKNTIRSMNTQQCNPRNMAIRQSWDNMQDDERKDYLRAVNCLAAKPALTDKKLAPGVVNRLDDFTYIHINQTNIIHNSGSLLPWHRAFLWDMEKALRDECGYKGWLPYWDFGRYASDQTKSPVFDGSATSFGGDGTPTNHSLYIGNIPGLVKPFPLPKPAGNGGGCVPNGPFTNLSLSLGPVVVAQANQSNLFGLEPNHRCLSRDFFTPSSAGNLTWDVITQLASKPDIASFRTMLEVSIHLNGHLSIGGEGADPFSPTNDPAFYLLHGMIDRVWAIWQGQDVQKRTYAIDGPNTFFGIPLAIAPDVPTRNATLEDVMDLGIVGGKISIKDGMSATANGRCYMYV